MSSRSTQNNPLWRIAALVFSLLQFSAPFISRQFTNFVDLQTKYNLPEKLYLEPAGPAFSIWGFIYLGFAVMGFYQMKNSLKDEPKWVLARPYMVLVSIGNIVWLISDAFANTSICLLAFMVLLYGLIKLHDTLRIAKDSFTLQEKLTVKYPVSLYFGWVSFAFSLGVILWLMSFFQISGNEVLSPGIWSTIVVAIAGSIFLFLYLRNLVTTSYALVGVWGFYWVYVKTSAYAELLATVALTAMIFLLISIVLKKGISFVKRRQNQVAF
ncbi:MAG: hypothetical protein AAFY71_02765 [Bacteroidota bacterium]